MASEPHLHRQEPPGRFVRELNRAAATRGRLDGVYQELSDRWTGILQLLYPVWALIGPGLSDPGHIEVHSRQIYLDSDTLLGTRQQILAGELERRAVLCCFGVAFHETFHAKHTKRWAVEHELELAQSEDPADQQLAVDRRLLEEPRMEAHGVRYHPAATVRGRFVSQALAAAVVDVIVPAFAQQTLAAAMTGRMVTRDMAGRAHVYLQARTHYGIVDRAVLDGLHGIWRQVLGEHDLAALDDLYARVIWIADGDLEGLDRAAGEYRAIIGPPDPDEGQQADGSDTTAGGAGSPGDLDNSDGAGGDGAGAGGKEAGGGVGVDAGSLTEALGHALAEAKDGQLQQLNIDQDLDQLLTQAANRAGGPGGARGYGHGTGVACGRMPDRGVDRPPAPDEIQHARRYATRLRQALTAGTRRTDKRTPGGRFDGRAYARGRAQRQAGRPVSTHPWQITRQVHAPIQEPHVGLIIDTSGSMGGYEYALGPICWIVTDALRQIGGRVATALFGDSVALLSDGLRPMPQVPGIRTGGGTAFAGDAIELVSDHLEIENQRRPRFIYVISDGGWSDTQAGVGRIRQLAELNVLTVHISIGIEPLSVECDRIHVIDDPAQAFDRIAADTVQALQARRRTPRTITHH
jgi:hypothetical protein